MYLSINISRNAAIAFGDDSWIFFSMFKFSHRIQKLSRTDTTISPKGVKTK